MKRTLSTAAVLIGLALALAVIGLVLKALRWLLIIAVVILVIGALVGARGRSSSGGSAP